MWFYEFIFNLRAALCDPFGCQGRSLVHTRFCKLHYSARTTKRTTTKSDVRVCHEPSLHFKYSVILRSFGALDAYVHEIISFKFCGCELELNECLGLFKVQSSISVVTGFCRKRKDCDRRAEYNRQAANKMKQSVPHKI